MRAPERTASAPVSRPRRQSRHRGSGRLVTLGEFLLRIGVHGVRSWRRSLDRVLGGPHSTRLTSCCSAGRTKPSARSGCGVGGAPAPAPRQPVRSVMRDRADADPPRRLRQMQEPPEEFARQGRVDAIVRVARIALAVAAARHRGRVALLARTGANRSRRSRAPSRCRSRAGSGCRAASTVCKSAHDRRAGAADAVECEERGAGLIPDGDGAVADDVDRHELQLARRLQRASPTVAADSPEHGRPTMTCIPRRSTALRVGKRPTNAGFLCIMSLRFGSALGCPAERS
jgi:hypothetical protein